MDVFALLAEPVRRRIIEILATGEHSSTDVADVIHHEFGVSHSAVSRHLRILDRSGFAIARVQGPYRMYRLDSTALDQLDRAVDRLHELWDARYGWPYLADPLAAERMPGLPSPNRDRGRGRRGRSAAPVIAEINEDNDPWYWLGD
jgi:DNA-binding transcriptional ArsR family regulator